MTVDAVIFDWGGTLSVYVDVDLYDMWALAADHLSAACGLPKDDLQARLLAGERRYWDRVERDWETGSLADILAAESAALGLDVAEAVLEEVATRHLDAWTEHIRHHDDAVPTITALRDRGCKIGLLSNTHWPPSFHEHFLDRDGLASLIDVRAYTSDMAYSKPHPSAFKHVLDALGVDPAGTVMVGDRPVDDIWGAQQLGMRAVWRRHALAPSQGWIEPDAVIERLSDLPALVDRWRE